MNINNENHLEGNNIIIKNNSSYESQEEEKLKINNVNKDR